MKSILTALLLLPVISFGQAKYNTYFEKGNGNQSATYAETIHYFKMLDTDFATVEMREMGTTDSGEPLHIVTFNPAQQFDFAKLSDKAVLLINNGIHAGEPDGIDATMMLFRDLALGKIKVPKNTVVVAIPVYNIGGALNRNSTSRVNQEGPEEYGFRGNARNFDLNRDFIKTDTKNTRSFTAIFHLIQPDVFIDNHVSNGADYQYTLTYIMTQPDKLGKPLGAYFRNQMVPELLSRLKQQKIETTPYVNAWETTPDRGFVQFFESPRFATGYTSLFNTLGFVVETHMLKKYADRVRANYAFMQQTIDYTDKHFLEIKAKRIENEKQYAAGKSYPVRWAIDSSQVSNLTFLGYEGGYKKSEATTANRLFYDRNKPYKRDIRYLDHYKPIKEIVIPRAYVIPQGFWPVINLLQSNQIEYRKIQRDTVMEVESYRIADYKTSQNAYEGHYPHRDTQVIASRTNANFRKGDYIFETNQKGVKYLLETLEPEAADSFFNWNFFDTMLQQKEGYSDYVFEDLAAQLLKSNAKLKSDLELKKTTEAKFAADPKAQLDWIYKHSVYYEKAHLQYPVYRILN